MMFRSVLRYRKIMIIFSFHGLAWFLRLLLRSRFLFDSRQISTEKTRHKRVTEWGQLSQNIQRYFIHVPHFPKYLNQILVYFGTCVPCSLYFKFVRRLIRKIQSVQFILYEARYRENVENKLNKWFRYALRVPSCKSLTVYQRQKP